MTSVATKTIGYDFSADALAASNKINGAQLQAVLVDLYNQGNLTLTALLTAIRVDNTLSDGLVRNRNLHAEVSTLLGITAGWQPRAAVAVASTANLVLTGEQTIDDVLTAASRVLVKNQTLPAENGIYVTGAGAWTRATDVDTAAELGRSTTYVSGGTLGTGGAWVVAEAASAITLGVTAITWAQFGAQAKDGGNVIYPHGVVALTDAAIIATDVSLGDTFDVTLAGNRTLGAPTNPKNGMKCIWRVKQDGVGTRTLAFNAAFRFSGAGGITSIVLSTGVNLTDYIGAQYNSAAAKWDILAFEPGH